VGSGQEVDADVGAERLVHRGLEARRALAAAERGLAPAQRDGAFPARRRRQLLEGRIDLLSAGEGATSSRHHSGEAKSKNSDHCTSPTAPPACLGLALTEAD